jgi:hypothetical protein
VKKQNKLFISVLILILSLCLNAVLVCAQDEVISEQKNLAKKEVQGEVSGIGYGSISIVYQRDIEKGTAEEILLPVDEVEQIIHKQNIKQINVGDTVSIQYDEITQETENGPNILRKAKVITFIKPAAPLPMESEVLETETADTEVLQ